MCAHCLCDPVLVKSHLNRGCVSESEGGVCCCVKLVAELSHSAAVLPGKIAWNLNLVLCWDTHTPTHTVWSLTEDTLFSCLSPAQGEFIQWELLT